MLPVATIVKIWAQSLTLVGDNTELMFQTHHDPLITELCAQRMAVLHVAEELLSTLLGKPDLPQPLIDFFNANADKGCDSCWLSARAVTDHEDCAFKINRWFDCRAALQMYGSEL